MILHPIDKGEKRFIRRDILVKEGFWSGIVKRFGVPENQQIICLMVGTELVSDDGKEKVVIK